MFLHDLITQLEGRGVGTYGQNLFRTTKAAVPVLASGAATLNVIATGGTSPTNTQNSVITPAYIRPGAQLTARATTYAAAEALAQAAYEALFVTNSYINSGWYLRIRPLQEPFDGGIDSRGQVQVQFNVLAERRRSDEPTPDWLAFLLANDASDVLIAQVRSLFALIPGLKMIAFSDISGDSNNPTPLLGPCTVYGGVVIMGLIDGAPVANVTLVVDTDVEAIFRGESKSTGQQSFAALPSGVVVGTVQTWYEALDDASDPVPLGDLVPANSPSGFVVYV